MRIAMIAPVWIPVPPQGYGGIERMLKLLVDELVNLGNQVTLFASGPSHTRAEQVIFFKEAPEKKIGETLYDAYHVGKSFRYIKEDGHFDIVHDHSGYIGVAFASLLDIPVVHTLHGPLTPEAKMFYTAFSQDAFYITISHYQMTRCPHLNYLGVVHNAIDIQEYQPSTHKEDYLVYVSRICADKGTHHAARIAKENGYRLLIAGKIDPGKDEQYFHTVLKPYLDDKDIVYLGEVSQKKKLELFSRARAFLFPIQWEEPFGLVMAESLACGTPVVATRFGAAPEVIEHGRTGFLVDNLEEIPRYLERIDEIDPEECRRVAQERFSPRRMAQEYLAYYEEAIDKYLLSHESDRAGSKLNLA